MDAPQGAHAREKEIRIKIGKGTLPFLFSYNIIIKGLWRGMCKHS